MALTAEGIGALWEAIRPRVARLRVSDGTTNAETPVADVTVDDADQDGVPELAVTAEFPADQANFEWTETAVVLDDGTVLDAEPGDLGRKTSASSARITVRLDLDAASG